MYIAQRSLFLISFVPNQYWAVLAPKSRATPMPNAFFLNMMILQHVSEGQSPRDCHFHPGNIHVMNPKAAELLLHYRQATNPLGSAVASRTNGPLSNEPGTFTAGSYLGKNRKCGYTLA